ncbi:beta-lactamase-like protein [Mycena haematopus]|nr:beta-lactamase-like protein [Mycena haematopus]
MISDKARVLKQLNVIGPHGISHYMASMRFHLSRDSVHANVEDAKMIPNLTKDPTPCFQDENITVYGIPILHVNTNAARKEQEDSPADTDVAWKNQVIRLRRLDMMFPNKGQTCSYPDHPFNEQDHPFHEQLPHLYEEPPPFHLLPTMAYVAILTPPVSPKQVPDKKDVLGASPDEHQTMRAANTVTETADNTTTPLAQPELFQVVMVLDVPSPSYIASLRETFARSPFYRKFRAQTPKYIMSVFHLCGRAVLEDERYVAFMNIFPPDTNHIVSSPQYDRDLVTFQTDDQLMRNRLDPVVFPAPKMSSQPEKKWNEIRGLPANCFPLEAGLELRIQPVFRPAVSFPTPPTENHATSEFKLSNPAWKELQALPMKVRETDWGNQRRLLRRAKDGKDRNKYARLRGTYDVNIITLGTSGTGPGLYRNAPSTLIRIPKRGSILLNCGEGTWGQLVRQLGAHGANDLLRDLRCIFISGVRIDYHGGLATLLSKRQQLDPPARDPLYLMADYSVHLYLREVSDIENLGIANGLSKNGVISVRNEMLYSSVSPQGFAHHSGWADPARSYEARTELCRVLGLLTFTTLAGKEPPGSHPAVDQRKSCGVVFRHKDGWSIVYAGNNVSQETLMRAGKDVTVFIHEGRLAAQRASARITREMEVDHLLFTHLPGRTPYPMRPLWERQRDPMLKPMISYAFDHANVSIGTLWKLNRYLPTLQRLYREHQQKIKEARNVQHRSDTSPA